MGHLSACAECEEIAWALAQAYLDAWCASDRGTRAAWKAVYGMIGGTEADVERVQELLPAVKPVHLGVNQILKRKFQHEARTGHKAPRAFRDRNL